MYSILDIARVRLNARLYTYLNEVENPRRSTVGLPEL